MKTILLVDDDAAFRTLFGRFLEDAGYKILYAESGDEAMQILEERHKEIALAIVDLVLPGSTDGFQIIGAIARRQTIMKVIAITGRLRNTFLETCKYMGAHAVIRKPAPEEKIPAQMWMETIKTVLDAEADLDRASGKSV